MRLITFFILLSLFSCNQDDTSGLPTEAICDYTSLLSEDQYVNAAADELEILSLEIQGDCLQITFAASGCDGNSWDFKLIDSEQIMESLPIQRNVRLSLSNNEECLAVISKTATFDLTPLQVVNENEVYLNIINSDEQILYEYQ